MEREPASTLNQQYLFAILPGGPEYIHYVSPRRSYVRALEKRVSSLIPPAATFRLPAAWQRIGSEIGERSKGKSHRRERCRGRARSFEQSYAILIPLPIPSIQIRPQFEVPPPERWDSSDLFLFLNERAKTLSFIREP